MRENNVIATNLLEPHYTPAERAFLDTRQSHINVARALLRARVDQGLSQEELGKTAGTNQSRVSAIEAMKGNPRFDTLDRIARVLGLTITLRPKDRWARSFATPPAYRQLRQGTTESMLTSDAATTLAA